MQKILFACTLLFFAACSNRANQEDSTADGAKSSSVHAGADAVTAFSTGKPFVLAGCYEMIFKKDTANLLLEVNDTLVSGSLTYHLASRDKNTGTLKGSLRDSLIIADYTFQSEGISSVREVIFKVKDSTLVQAFGAIEEKQNKFVFQDRASLQYMDQSPFVKVTCGAPTDGR